MAACTGKVVPAAEGTVCIFIDPACLPDADNEWNVYTSIKLLGNPCQKDSQKKPLVLVDRILLVR